MNAEAQTGGQTGPVAIPTLADLDGWVGREIGVSDWLTIGQERIDLFAEATGDRQWIHVDRERAAREMPGGKTIAHGYLLVSLLPGLAASIFWVERRSRSLNYGSDKVRFITPVPSGGEVRLRLSLTAAEPVEGGRRLAFLNRLELRGAERPAMIAETLSLAYD